MFKKICIITTISLIFTLESSFAFVLPVQDVTPKSIFIQIGALKKKQSLEELVKKFKKYPLYIERVHDINKIFVIFTDHDKNMKHFLKKIHKIVPDAFIKRNFQPHKQIVVKKVQKEVNKKYFDNSLNSEAILRTRKKFFK